MAQIGAVLADVDYCAGLLAGMPAGAFHLHHRRVADAHPVAVDHGADALAGLFLYIFNHAVVILFGICGAQRGGDGMGAEALDVGCEVQQLPLLYYLGMHCHHFEDTFGQGAGLVEDYCVHP